MSTIALGAVDSAGSPTEQAFAIPVDGDCLVGILHLPASQVVGAQQTGVVIVVGGPQYRAGSHRQFVQLARHLASAGHAVLRFDVRGMGDSTGAMRDFEHIGDDIGAAIDELARRQPQVQHVVLWGLCDGASAALLYLHERTDPRVQGLCLLNPWVRSEASLARTQVKHYYAQRLMQREFWLKLMRGQVAGAALRGLWNSLRAASGGLDDGAESQPFQTRMAQAWHHFAGRILLVLSGRDYTAREFREVVAAHPAWQGALDKPLVQLLAADAADHTFSDSEEARSLERSTAAWLREHFATDAGPAAAHPGQPSTPADRAAGLHG